MCTLLSIPYPFRYLLFLILTVGTKFEFRLYTTPLLKPTAPTITKEKNNRNECHCVGIYRWWWAFGKEKCCWREKKKKKWKYFPTLTIVALEGRKEGRKEGRERRSFDQLHAISWVQQHSNLFDFLFLLLSLIWLWVCVCNKGVGEWLVFLLLATLPLTSSISPTTHGW